ncbi:hypothetical protein BGZ60DRAFT_515447 [Tricladium varicosporioides]|nr:hypothetical protein BGZ60DRAFT_515447 [Hymenoscyphus varicosporioides]
MAQPQAQAARPKPSTPLDVLQGMLSGILIETGRALKASNKDGGRALASSNARLQATIPTTAENFQQALDELESDILRAKAVLLRDLNELRDKRIALENPAPIIEEPIPSKETALELNSSLSQSTIEETQLMLQPDPYGSIKVEKLSRSPERPQPQSLPQQPDPPKETIATEPEVKVQQPSPPASSANTTQESKPIGLGINTTTTTDPNTSAPDTAGPVDSAIDSLFDIPESGTNDDDLNFDDMDFAFNSTADTGDQSQTQNNDFDLSTFGNDSQNFTMPTLDTSTDAATNLATNANANANDKPNLADNKDLDDIFGDLSGGAGGDVMDLDLNMDGMDNMVGAEESVFDDIFFDTDNNMGGSGEGDMEHGNFDNNFFGIDD